MEINYGKRIVSDSYFNGELKSKKVTYSIPVVVSDQAEALTEIMKALELITSSKTHELSVVIKSDPKTHQFKLVTKNYTVSEK
jgi:glutamyl/glutaminyl-tRNA synthetase